MQLYHITINNLRRRKMKIFFILLGIMIGIATIVSVYGVVETMKIEMTRQAAEFGVNVIITPDAGGLTFSYGGITLPEMMYDVEQLTTEDVNALEALPSQAMIRAIAPKLMGVEQLHGGQKVIFVGVSLREEFLAKPWLRLRDPQQVSKIVEMSGGKVDSNEEKKMDFEAIDLSRQNLQALNLADNQVFLGSALALSLGVKEGDLLQFSDRELIVKGILLESGTAEDQQMFMNLSVAQDILGRPNEITAIEMVVDYTLGLEEALLTEIKEVLPHAHVTSLRQETLRRNEMLVRLARFGMALSILVLLVGMLVVGLSMSASVRERTREIGLFRALGFRQSHIAKMIVMEGIIMSIVGGLVGYLGGMGIARYVGPRFAAMDIVVPWRIDLLLIAIGIAVVIGVLSSLYPAHQAAKQDPSEALRFI